jgi:hypothetical protein
MAVAPDNLAAWLEQAHIPQQRLTAQQQALLQAAFCFRQRQGHDYFATRVLGHFLLHCHSGLKVAQIARLLGISRQTASGQQGLSAKAAIQQAHHRLDGRPYGKLLPRYAGPIAGFLLTHPDATREDLLDFIAATFNVRVSRIALYKFLKKYGLGRIPDAPTPAAAQPLPAVSTPAAEPLPAARPRPVPAGLPVPPPPAVPRAVPLAVPVPAPAPPFSSAGRTTQAPSC